jgi:hypothetical protein
MGSKKLPRKHPQYFVISVTQLSFDIRGAVAQKSNKRAG